jgi:aspartate dehydrogenase
MKLGLLGCGSIGGYVATTVDRGAVAGVELAVITDADRKKADSLLKKLRKKPKIAENVDEMLSSDVGVILEAASQGAVKEYAVRILQSRKPLIIMSVGALADEKLLSAVEREVNAGARVFIPSGAICGLDGVKSAKNAGIDSVTLTTTKPANTLKENDYIKKQGLNLSDVPGKTVVFEGSAREAAKAFPQSINVSIALSLAGIGVEKTKVKIIADPHTKTNSHEVSVKGKFGELHAVTNNLPFPENPKTSYLAALSALAMLKEISVGMCVGN